MLSILAFVALLAVGSTPAEAAKCGSKTVTKVNTVAINSFFGTQTSVIGSNSGVNAIIGSIGTNTLVTGTNTTTSTQTMSGINTNTVTVGVSTTGSTSTGTVTNTGNNVNVCF